MLPRYELNACSLCALYKSEFVRTCSLIYNLSSSSVICCLKIASDRIAQRKMLEEESNIRILVIRNNRGLLYGCILISLFHFVVSMLLLHPLSNFSDTSNRHSLMIIPLNIIHHSYLTSLGFSSPYLTPLIWHFLKIILFYVSVPVLSLNTIST